ncbi:hypothetical protein [Streptomyces macrosporus]
MVRTRCAEEAERRGAIYRTDFSRGVTLVVYGDLAGKVVTDPRRAYSSTLVDVEEERRRGRHVCVVDGDGFSNLLRRRSAPCLELRRTGQGVFALCRLPRPGTTSSADPSGCGESAGTRPRP